MPCHMLNFKSAKRWPKSQSENSSVGARNSRPEFGCCRRIAGSIYWRFGRLRSWSKQPLVVFLRHMSAKYQINFTSLLMPELLPPSKRPTDHRARFGKRPLSIDTLVAIEDVTDALEAFQDIASETTRIVPS